MVLIFGEISPKGLAKEMPERFAMFSDPILRVLILILTPVNFVFVQWKKLLSKLFHARENNAITEDELLTIVEEAEHDGSIDEQESGLIRSAIVFNDLTAEDILTPRVDVVGIPADADRASIAAAFSETGFSRLPVYEDTIDNVIGIVLQKDFYNAVYSAGASLKSILKPALFIAGSMKIGDLLAMLQKNKVHLAVISDEYGGMVGIVTMEDILEELVGEIWDEHEEVVEEFQELSDGLYKVLCSADLNELFERFRLTGESEAATVSGWVIEQLGRIPDEGESFTYELLTITVHKTDGRRVLEILVTVNSDTQK